MSSASELTDLDDEEFSPSLNKGKKSKSKSKTGSDSSGYKIRGALKVPRATTYTCQSLYEQIFAQDIDLQAEYQRAVVWPDSKQIGLVDSIFRNFYVPPVIFVVNSLDDGGERRICVDGKQRLTSIYRFISGEIPYKDAFTGEKFVFKDTGKIKAQLLPERYKKLFLNKQIVCMEYQDITPANEREIFQRVQLGMALTPAEKLQAISGPQADFVRELLDTYVADLSGHISWDTSRANDFRGLAMVVYTVSRWPRQSTLPSLAVVEAWLQESEDLDDDFCEDVHNTYRIFVALAKDTKLNKPFWLPGVKKVAPMEVFAISVLIHTNKKKMTLAQLSEAIGMMRKELRKTEKDIRQNTRAMKLVMAFLKDLKPLQLKGKDSPGEPVAYETQLVKKKKRIVKHSPDEDVDMEPPPAKRSTSAPQPPAAPVKSPPVPPPAPVRSPPTGPAALRQSASTALPPRPAVPLPPQIPASRPGSLGNTLMARMMTKPSNDPRGYDPSRDPRHTAYQPHPSHPR